MDRHGPFGAVVVDDDAVILMDAAGILEDAGFRVFTAMHAEEAIQHLCENDGEIGLLFTDVDMPGEVDGFELARRTARRWPRIGVVVASGRRPPAPGDLPADATFIAKPFSAEIVRHHVQLVLPEAMKPEPLRRDAG